MLLSMLKVLTCSFVVSAWARAGHSKQGDSKVFFPFIHGLNGRHFKNWKSTDGVQISALQFFCAHIVINTLQNFAHSHVGGAGVPLILVQCSRVCMLYITDSHSFGSSKVKLLPLSMFPEYFRLKYIHNFYESFFWCTLQITSLVDINNPAV